jgi:arsenate reductase
MERAATRCAVQSPVRPSLAAFWMPPYNVLFLCTGNSARSIIAEALLAAKGKNRFHAFSAGSHPKGAVHPLALETLKQANLPTAGLRSKSWDEFAGPDSPALHFVFTVCGNAANERCPTWHSQPITANWIIDDPAAAEGTEEQKRQAFQKAFRELSVRVQLFTSFLPEELESLAIREKLDQIGRLTGESSGASGSA